MFYRVFSLVSLFIVFLISAPLLIAEPSTWGPIREVSTDDSTSQGKKGTNHGILAPVEKVDQNLQTNLDPGSVGIIIKTDQLEVNESGKSIRFFVHLKSKPLETTTLGLTNLSPDEAKIFPKRLIFNPKNWEKQQSVSVTGLNDDTDDGDKEVLIRLEVVQGDFYYSNLAAKVVSFINKDNDVAGIAVGPASGDTNEKGGTATFSVKLQSSPKAPVKIPVLSSIRSEAQVKPKMLIFTKNNWSKEQSVVATGQNDYRRDGDAAYEIRLGPAKSLDPGYQGLKPPAVKLVNRASSVSLQTLEQSHKISTMPGRLKGMSPLPVKRGGVKPNQLQVIKDIPGEVHIYSLSITPLQGEVSERGEKSQFKVKLTSAISISIPMIVTVNQSEEAAVTPSHLIFTPENWNREQIITVTGLDDSVVDGDKNVKVLFKIDELKIQRYVRLNVPKISLINKDNDTPGIVIGEHKAFTVEDGGKTRIPLKLRSKPFHPVRLYLVSDSPGEAELQTKSVVFTPKNWDEFQTITVAGKNDFIADGDTPFSIRMKQIKSKDQVYNRLFFPGIRLVNKEIANSSNNIKISGTLPVGVGANLLFSGSANSKVNNQNDPKVKEVDSVNRKADYSVTKLEAISNESGRAARLEVKLNSKPTDQVRIRMSTNNSGEAVVKPAELVFTPTNWNKAQLVKVIGQDDDAMDGDISYQVEFKTESDRDFRYSRLPNKVVELVNMDNDKARFIVETKQKQTTENGNNANISVYLGSKPAASVTIPVKSENIREGNVAPRQLVFDPENWQQPQTIIVTGQDDKIADRDQFYNIRLGPAKSADQNYQNLLSKPVRFINKDNDQAALRLAKIKSETGEGGEAVNVTVSLATEPEKLVFLDVISSNKKEGIPKPARLEFTAKNWRKPQIIKIVGQDDAVNDGDISYQVKLSTLKSKDARYSELPDQILKLVNEDNDRAGIWLGEVSGQPGENNDLAVFGIKLKSKPIHPVEISITSTNRSEGEILNNLLHFTPENWSTQQPVQVKGIDDSVADGNKPFKAIARVKSSKDPRYELLDSVAVELVNADNDKAGFRIVKPLGKTSENGDQTTFSVALMSKPANMVTIALASDDLSEGLTDTKSLTFSPKNWNQPRLVTITGVNDQLVDGEQNYSIVLKPAISSDPVYSGLNPDDVRLSNLDNNLTTFFVSKVRGNTSERGQKVSFNVRLNAKPKGKVVIKIVSDTPIEARPDLETLWFDQTNWDQTQKVTITGFDDSIDDGDIPYQITITSTSDTDPAYEDIPPVKLKLINKDDDKTGIQVKLINKMSSENGEEAQFSIRLTSKPTSSVVLLFESTKPTEAQLVTKHAAFLSHNWNKEQIIRIKGITDQLVDGNQEFAIISSGAVSSDPLYNKLLFESIKFVNKDMDEARIVVGKISGDTTEAGDNASFTARLSSRPRAPVSIGLHSDNAQEGTVDKHKLEFDETNWDQDQVVTVTGIDDFIKDEDKPYHIVFSSSVSDDGHFHGLSPRWISLKNLDNKKFTIGVFTFYTLPLGSFADDFDATLGYSLTGGYVFNGYVTITGAYQIVELSGTPERSLYGDMHKVEQTLTLNSVVVGMKIVLMKQPIQFSIEPTLSLVNWEYHSKTLTDGTEQVDEDQDFGIGFKAGIDYPLYESLFLESSFNILQLTGGLGDRQLISLGAGFYFPF